MRFSLSLLGTLLVLILSGCGSAYNPPRAEVSSPNFVPEWYLDPPKERDFLYASAKGRSANPSQAVQRARRRATGQFSTVFTEAVGRILDSEADTSAKGSSDWEALLERVESDPSSVLELEARRVGRHGDEYLAYVPLRGSLDDLLPPDVDGDTARSRLRDFYERVNHERTASRGVS